MNLEKLYNDFEAAIGFQPWSAPVIWFGLLLVAAWIAYWIATRVLVRLVAAAILRTSLHDEASFIAHIGRHLAAVLPALVVSGGIDLIPGMPDFVQTVVQLAAKAFIIFTLARTICDVFDLVNHTYEQSPDAAARPIKGYLQVGKLLVYGAALILIIATFTGESPLLLLSGLGAVTAVLLLVFKDTILSLVASVQIRSNDMIRVGDWIEMSQLNADGDVIDISLHVVRVQNFDKTVTTIPTYKLISESFRNWRGMRDYGARRIKRSINIDMSTVGFLSDSEWRDLHRFALLRPYLEQLEGELAEWNREHAGDGEDVNKRRPTNIGTFRAYVVAMLKANDAVSEQGTLLVRQLEPTDKGVPLEIYCFAATTAWKDYEAIQSDIFDHLLAIMPEFGLLPFQQPSGHDLVTSDGKAGAA
ncbi:MAG: mechanosensitive ion channel [Sphingomonadaceae bacterium]